MKTNARASWTLCTRMNPRMHHTTSEQALREYRNHVTSVRERSRGWGVPVAGNIHEVASPSEVHRVHAQTQQQQQRGPLLPTPLLSTHNCLVNFCIPYEPLHREPYRRLKRITKTRQSQQTSSAVGFISGRHHLSYGLYFSTKRQLASC